MKRVLLLLSAGFEELEVVAPLDLLRRAGIDIISASLGVDLWVEGSHGIKIQADRLFVDCHLETFDMVVLPGGPGVKNMRKDPGVLDLVRKAYANGTPLAAICAGPLILAEAGVIALHTVTSFPGVQSELTNSIKAYSENRVVADGNIITSRGAGTAEEFALALIEILLGEAAAEKVRTSIVAR